MGSIASRLSEEKQTVGVCRFTATELQVNVDDLMDFSLDERRDETSLEVYDSFTRLGNSL